MRAVSVTAGRAAAQRALPLYLGIWTASSVLFEGNGVRPADVVAGALGSRSGRLLLYSAWTVVSFPAIRALLTTPSSFFLRTLPVARWRLVSVHAAGLLLAQAPWAYLWLRGGGLALGSAAITAAIALSTLLLGRCEWRSEKLAAALLIAGLYFADSWPLLLGVSLPAAAIGLRGAWLRAPESRTGPTRSWVAGPAPLALASSYAAVLWRQAGAQVARAAGFSLLALTAAHFALKNALPASSTEQVVLATTLLSPALILGMAGLCGPVLRTEGQLGWLLAVCGTSRSTESFARLAPLAVYSASLALVHAIALAVSLHAPLRLGLGLALSEVAAGLLLCLLVSSVVRWGLRADGNDSRRLLLGVGGLLLVTMASLTWLGTSALLGWAVLAGLSLAQAQRSRRPALALPSRSER